MGREIATSEVLKMFVSFHLSFVKFQRGHPKAWWNQTVTQNTRPFMKALGITIGKHGLRDW